MAEEYDVSLTMAAILGTMMAVIVGLVMIQTPNSKPGMFLPCSKMQPSKRAYELFALFYTPIWIFAFACIVAFGLYETFDKWSYMKVCVGLASPFLLQPLIFPSAGFDSPDANRPLFERYSFKANLWIAVYSFIGNYWYTHCKTTTYTTSNFRFFMSECLTIFFRFLFCS
jgi:cycloeucalenol cycloisomerase